MFFLVLQWLVLLAVFMVFNRIRGGGMYALTDRLPGRALYYVSFIFGGLTAAFFNDWVLGLIVGLGFLIWGAPGWGLWFDLHRDDKKQENDRRHDALFVRAISLISFNSDYVAMFWRLGLFVLPMLGAWVWLSGESLWILMAAIPFAVLGVVAYELRWRTLWGNTLSEMLIGALWWGLITTMAYSV